MVDTQEYMEEPETPTLVDPIANVLPPKEIPVMWQGNKCTLHIVCHDDETLPMVVDQFGQKYKDNRFEVSVKSSDGSVLYHQLFDKSMLLPYIDDSNRRAKYARKAILTSVEAEVDSATSKILHFYAYLEDLELELGVARFEYNINGNCKEVDQDELPDEYGI